MTIFRDYTDLVEPLSLDEAYLDVTENKKGMRSATIIAREIKASINEKTWLTASAGISINKFLAKVASGMNKPDGLTVINPGEVHEFIKTLPIEKFFGIGKVTAAKMKALGIYNGSDLLEFDQLELLRYFGEMGNYFYKVVRGEDNRKVKPERIRKSLGAECTFDNDIVSMQTLHKELKSICEELGRRLAKSNVSGKTVTLKIKYFDFDLKTRSVSLNTWQNNTEEIFGIAKNLLHSDNLPGKAIRLLGVSLSNLNDGSEKGISNQLTLEF
jgi:DNA polymerase-4